MARIALLGGAFNPPHLGHLRMAELALEHLGLDGLRFVPTAASPHKPPAPGIAEAGARVQMLEALLKALPPVCGIDTLELDRGGTSYTADTLESLRAREPGNAWILLIGSDQLPDFPRWQRAARILELASLAVVQRPGWEAPLPAELESRRVAAWSGASGEVVCLPSSERPFASSALRENLRLDRAPAGLPPEVVAAITAENLYRE